MRDLPASPVVVLAYAREWVGTPWLRRSARRGVGSDCVGLIRGVIAEVSGVAIPAPGWRADWPRDGLGPIAEAAAAYLLPIAPGRAAPGHVVTWRVGSRVAHVGIKTPSGFLHASEVAGVVEVSAVPWEVSGAWAIRCADDCFPGAPDLVPEDLLAILYGERHGGPLVALNDGRDGTPLGRSARFPTMFDALKAVPRGVQHIERVD